MYSSISFQTIRTYLKFTIYLFTTCLLQAGLRIKLLNYLNIQNNVLINFPLGARD